MESKKVRFVINDHMTSYLRFFAKKGFSYSAKALEMTSGYSEIVFPISPWFNKDWSVNEIFFEEMRKRDLLKNHGTFHSIMEFHPTHPERHVDYDDPDDLERNITILKAQIGLCARLAAMYYKDGPAILVCHPAGSRDQNPQVFIDRIVGVFEKVLEYADEKNVQISFEPDIGRGKIFYHGSARNFHNVANIVEKLTLLAPRKNVKTPVSITYDLSHTLLENERDFSVAQNIIREFGSFITYAHINHPILHYFKKLGVPVLSEKLHKQRALKQIWHIFLYTQDGHNPIYRVTDQEKLNDTLRLLKDKTRIPEFGRINLEVGTRWDRGINFFRSGASGMGTYKSLALLDQIFNS
jgi:hypothetical protein